MHYQSAYKVHYQASTIDLPDRCQQDLQSMHRADICVIATTNMEAAFGDPRPVMDSIHNDGMRADMGPARALRDTIGTTLVGL